MTQPGRPLASGRAADVYALGDRHVLRRYRTEHSVLHEAAVMQFVRAHGYPAPEVVEVAGGDMVMERIDGPTMLTALARRPWSIGRYARTLAQLHRRLHAIRSAPWVEPRLGGGDAIVHIDLHPDNVILSARGPVVIDWTNAGRGDPDVDLAHLWLIMATSIIPGDAVTRTVAAAGRRLFLRAFLHAVDREALRPHLGLAAEHRSRDRNVLDPERDRIRRFVERWGR